MGSVSVEANRGPTFRNGTISGIGRLRNIAASIEASACRRTGSRSCGGLMKLPQGWKRPFDDPIPLPSSRQHITLKDAANYIQKLP
jgi:hypothetical protein